MAEGILKIDWWKEALVDYKPAKIKSADSIYSVYSKTHSGVLDNLSTMIKTLLERSFIDEDTKKQLASSMTLSSDMHKKMNREQLMALSSMVSAINLYAEKGLDSTAKVLVEALIDQEMYFKAYGELGNFGSLAYTDLVAQIDAGKTNASDELLRSPIKEDMDLALAFKSIGIDISFDYTKHQWKWENQDTYKDSKVGIKIPGKEEYFKFADDQIKNIIQNYFNNPNGRNSKVITPDALYSAYKRLCLEQVESLPDKQIIQTGISKQSQAFGTTTDSWKVDRLLNPDFIHSFARKAALKSIYDSRFTECIKDKGLSDRFKEYNQDDIISTTTKFKRHSQGFYALGKFENIINDFQMEISESVSFTLGDDYVALCDNQIAALQKKLKDGEKISDNEQELHPETNAITKQIIALQRAKEEFALNVEFQRLYMETYVEKNGSSMTPDLVKEASGNACGLMLSYGVDGNIDFPQRNDDKIFGAVQKTLIDRIQEIKSQNITQETSSQQSPAEKVNQVLSEMLPDIGGGFFAQLEDKDRADIVKAWKLELATAFWNEGNVFGEGYKEFVEEQEKKTPKGDTSIEAFADSIVGQTPTGEDSLFTKEDIVLGYAAHSKDPAKSNEIDAIQNNWRKYLLLLDRATRLMSSEEYVEYANPETSEQRRTEIVSEKINEAKKSIDDKKPEPTEEEYKLAEQRHKNNLLRRMTYAQEQSLPEEANVEKSAMKRYMDALSKDQSALDKAIQESGGLPVDFGNVKMQEAQNELEESQDETQKKTKTFKDLYPSAPDNEAFMKAMKPYCKKYLIKNFIKEILKKLENLKFPVSSGSASSAQTNGNQTQENDGDEVTVDDDAEKQAGGNGTTPIGGNSPQTNPQGEPASNLPKTITQSEFEAMCFMPGAVMLNKLYESSDPKSQDVKSVLDLFRLLSGDTKIEVGSKVIEGKTCIDALRHLALSVLQDKTLSQDPDKGLPKLMESLDKIKKDYEIQDEKLFDENVINGFKNLTPELMALMFAPCSEVVKNGENVTIEIGEKLVKGDLFKDVVPMQSNEERLNGIKEILSTNNMVSGRDLDNIKFLIQNQALLSSKYFKMSIADEKLAKIRAQEQVQSFVSDTIKDIKFTNVSGEQQNKPTTAVSDSKGYTGAIENTDKYREIFDSIIQANPEDPDQAHNMAKAQAEKFYAEHPMQTDAKPTTQKGDTETLDRTETSQQVQVPQTYAEFLELVEKEFPDYNSLHQIHETAQNNPNSSTEAKDLSWKLYNSASAIREYDVVKKYAPRAYEFFVNAIDDIGKKNPEEIFEDCKKSNPDGYRWLEVSGMMDEFRKECKKQTTTIQTEAKPADVLQSLQDEKGEPESTTIEKQNTQNATVSSLATDNKPAQAQQTGQGSSNIVSEITGNASQQKPTEPVTIYADESEAKIQMVIEQDQEYQTTIKNLYDKMVSDLESGKVSGDKANSEYQKGIYEAKMKVVERHCSRAVKFINNNKEALTKGEGRQLLKELEKTDEDAYKWLVVSGLQDYLLQQTKKSVITSNTEISESSSGNPSFLDKMRAKGASVVSSVTKFFGKGEQSEQKPELRKQQAGQSDRPPQNHHEFETKFASELDGLQTPLEKRKGTFEAMQKHYPNMAKKYLAAIEQLSKIQQNVAGDRSTEVKSCIESLKSDWAAQGFKDQDILDDLCNLFFEKGELEKLQEELRKAGYVIEQDDPANADEGMDM
ncbi:MAG: hypothetical protein IJW59_04695 [Clostridia bacterium]|nr:hypothetical protein [Clostridia bacterium]